MPFEDQQGPVSPVSILALSSHGSCVNYPAPPGLPKRVKAPENGNVMSKFAHIPSPLGSHPEAIERLMREALRRVASGGVPGDKKIDFDIALALALPFQRKMRDAREIVHEVLRVQTNHKVALWLEMLLAFFLNDPWPSAWEKLEARWGVHMKGEKPFLTRELWDGSPLSRRSILPESHGCRQVREHDCAGNLVLPICFPG